MPLTAHDTSAAKDDCRDYERSAFDSELGLQWGAESPPRNFVASAGKGRQYYGDISPRNVYLTKYAASNLGEFGFSQPDTESRTGLVEVLRENTRLRTEMSELKSEVAETRGLILQLLANFFDLSPIVLFEVDADMTVLRFRAPRTITVSLSADGKFFCASDEELGIDAFARSRTELVREIHSQLNLVWREYAKASDDILSPEARSLKIRLTHSIDEDEHAG